MHKHSQPRANGFIALLSAIIISALLLALLLATNLSSFYARFDQLDADSQTTAQQLANSCVQETLLRLAQNYSYTPAAQGDVVSLSAGNCTIVSVSQPDSNNDRIITTSANKQDSYATEIVTVQIKNPTLSAGGPNITVISSQEQ